jgi:pilus assembly protein CpaE
VLRTLKQQFDYVVIDTAPNFDEQTLQALDETDECIIVATLDVPTLKNVKVAIETLDLLSIAVDHRHLVLNRADDAVGLDNAKVEAILGVPITVPIPTSTDVAAATNLGTPIVLSNPDHPASQAFRQLAGAMAGDDLVLTPAESGQPVGRSDHERRGRRIKMRRA